MSDPVLEVIGLSKNFGALEVAHNIEFTLQRAARHALICLLYTSPSQRD